MVVYVVKVNCKLISLGAEDDKIKIEYEKNQKRAKSIFAKIIDKIVLGFFVLVFIALFGLGVSITVRENNVVGKIPSLKVVQSGSMAYVNEYNRYVNEEDVTEHIQTFDIVAIHELPAVEDLKVNDIVLYEIDGLLLVHRIVAIEPPNKEHPDEIHFLLHGDANELPDKFPVKYEQMKGIYRGERVPYVGTFVSFMQSPAGYLCILLVIFAVFAVPFAEKKIEKKKYARLVQIGVIQEGAVAVEEKPEVVVTEGKPQEETIVVEETTAEPIQVENLEARVAERATIEDIEARVAERATIEDIEVEQAITLDETYIDRAHSLGYLFATFNAPKSFEEKLSLADEDLKCEYREITSTLCRIEKVRATRSFKGETYRCKSKGICKLTIRGKTLNVYLALNPAEFENTKYIYEDVSNKKEYANYSMRVKVTSERQVKWVKELILINAEKNGFTVNKEPITNILDLFSTFKKSKSFNYKLRTASSEVKYRYKEITAHVKSFDRVRVIKGKKGETYKRGNVCICKLTIRGKTLNAYIGLDTKAFEDTKYIFTDASSSKAYANYPMRVKVTSERQVRWVKELITACIDGKGDK